MRRSGRMRTFSLRLRSVCAVAPLIRDRAPCGLFAASSLRVDDHGGGGVRRENAGRVVDVDVELDLAQRLFGLRADERDRAALPFRVEFLNRRDQPDASGAILAAGDDE